MGTRLGTELGTILGTVLGTDLAGSGGSPVLPALKVGFLLIGDSNMRGTQPGAYDGNSLVPGYPPASGLSYKRDDWGITAPLVEPADYNAVAPPAATAGSLHDFSGPTNFGTSWGTEYSYAALQAIQAVRPGSTVVALGCGKGGSNLVTQWDMDLDLSSPAANLLPYAILRAHDALKKGEIDVLGAVLVDLGTNDANVAGRSANWGARMTQVETWIREWLYGWQGPIVFKRHQPLKPAAWTSQAEWDTLIAQETAWANGTTRILYQSTTASEDSGLHQSKAEQWVNAQAAWDASAAQVLSSLSNAALPQLGAPSGALVGWAGIGTTASVSARVDNAASGADGQVGGTEAFGAMLFSIDSQAVSSTARTIWHKRISASGGFLVQTTGTNTSIRVIVYDTGNVGRTSTAYTVPAGDVSKILALVWKVVGNQLILNIKGADVGAPVACNGMGVNTVDPMRIGNNGGVGDGVTIYGVTWASNVAPSTANIGDWIAACQAAKRVVEMPGVGSDDIVNLDRVPDHLHPLRSELGNSIFGLDKSGGVTVTRVSLPSPVWA